MEKFRRRSDRRPRSGDFVDQNQPAATHGYRRDRFRFLIIYGYSTHVMACRIVRSAANLSPNKLRKEYVDNIRELGDGKRLMILAPIVQSKKGEFAHVPDQYGRMGFARARVDGVIALDEFPELDKGSNTLLKLCVDRVVNDAESITQPGQFERRSISQQRADRA